MYAVGLQKQLAYSALLSICTRESRLHCIVFEYSMATKRGRTDYHAMEAPKDLSEALERIQLLVKEVDRKEEEIKRLKTNGGKLKELVRYREENEKHR